MIKQHFNTLPQEIWGLKLAHLAPSQGGSLRVGGGLGLKDDHVANPRSGSIWGGFAGCPKAQQKVAGPERPTALSVFSC